MAAQKLGQVAWYMVTGSIKGFLVMCFPKTKKNQVCKNSYFFKTILKKIQEQGVLGSLSSNDLNYCSTVNIASLENFFQPFFLFLFCLQNLWHFADVPIKCPKQLLYNMSSYVEGHLKTKFKFEFHVFGWFPGI